MDAANTPEPNTAAAGGTGASSWRIVVMVLCAISAGLVIGILALQVTEYLFYQAPPTVWPPGGP